MPGPRRVAYLVVLVLIGLGAYGYFEGVPEADIANAVRAGDTTTVQRLLARDAALVHTKVFPQGYERADQRRAYLTREGRSPWQGRLLVHDAIARVESPRPMLDLLADAGADLAARLNGRTLLHLAARDGNLEVAAWLLEHGAQVNATNDCAGCPEAGWTPLHDAQAFRDDDMSEWLLANGARVDVRARSGQTPLHVAGAAGRLGGAFVLCRYGADPAAIDETGRTPHDLARDPGGVRDASRADDLTRLVEWLEPEGGCATVAASARASGAPVPDDEARVVFSRTVKR